MSCCVCVNSSAEPYSTTFRWFLFSVVWILVTVLKRSIRFVRASRKRTRAKKNKLRECFWCSWWGWHVTSNMEKEIKFTKSTRKVLHSRFRHGVTTHQERNNGNSPIMVLEPSFAEEGENPKKNQFSVNIGHYKTIMNSQWREDFCWEFNFTQSLYYMVSTMALTRSRKTFEI